MRTGLVVAASLFAVGMASAAEAGCGTTTDGLAFARAARRRLQCEKGRVEGHDVTCEDPDAACAAEVDHVAALVFGSAGGVDRRAYRSEWRCQRAMVSGVRAYLTRRIRDLVSGGRRRVPYAAKLVAKVQRRCDGVPTAGPLPTVGGECTALASPFDPTRAAHCVRAVLERIAQTATGVAVRPNIVLVLTDDQRWDTLDVMPIVRERLRDRGVEFQESFVSTSLCCPNRASILTGLYAHNHGVISNAGAWDFDHYGDTIARRLHELGGYHTALVGKYMVASGAALGTSVPPGWDEWHVFNSRTSQTWGLYYGYRLNDNGVETYYGLDGSGNPIPAEYSTDVLRDRTLDLLAAWRDEPFFVEYAPFAPHTPPVPAARHAGTFAAIPPWRPPSWLEADLSGKPTWVSVQAFFQALLGDAPARTDARRIGQLETLLAVDEAVGAISDSLEASGLTDNTMVLFSSDHGFLWLEHWLTLKNYPYDEAVRVPLIVRYPLQAPAPRVVDSLVQSIDLYPTFAELAAVATPAVNGRSFVPLLAGLPVAWRDDILLEHWAPVAGVDTSGGVRTDRWKLIETTASAGVTTELYDLLVDPYEITNVATDPDNAVVIDDLRTRLQALSAE